MEGVNMEATSYITNDMLPLKKKLLPLRIKKRNKQI